VVLPHAEEEKKQIAVNAIHSDDREEKKERKRE
jgi:hypothetical protein